LEVSIVGVLRGVNKVGDKKTDKRQGNHGMKGVPVGGIKERAVKDLSARGEQRVQKGYHQQDQKSIQGKVVRG